MNKVDMGIEVARVLGEIREKVSKDLDAIFESVVKDKLKSEYESNLDTNIYVIVERKTLKSLADRVEDIEYMMRWVETIDGLWPRILEDMKPQLENINVELKKFRKTLIDSMMDEIRRTGRMDFDIKLQENKRKIKVLLKK